MRVIYTLFFLIAVAVPTATSAQYLSQTEIEEMLALSGATPESAGMRQLRVCRLKGESKNPDTHPDQSSVGQAASDEVYQSLQRFAARYQVTRPQWSWRVTCTAEWQLITPGLTKLAGGEKRLEGLLFQDNTPKPVVATSNATSSEMVRVKVGEQVYVIKGQNLVAWNACKPLRFGAELPVARKQGCK